MRLKVFYLDDEPDLCEMFQENFETPDIEIKTFTDPNKFLGEMKTNLPHVVFLDYRLPMTNGDELAQKLPASIPKILLTGELEVNPKSNFQHIYCKVPLPWEDIENFLKSEHQKVA